MIEGVRNGSWDWRVLKSYGGMPSGHSAFVVSLATAIGMDQGFDSPLFAIVVVFAMIIIRDAVGLRMYLGRHGRAINRLIRTLPDEELSKFPVLREKLGHTYAEATIGGLLGIVTAFILYSVWP